jgi:FkbM family methyltransferase
MTRDLITRVRSAGTGFARRLLLGNAELTYSQEGEDRLLARLLEGAPPGFYVDVGAHDPFRFSNTACLYRAGWRGIAIDARPGFAETHRRARPRDVALEIGVAGKAQELEFFIFNDGALNTFSAERAAMLEQTTTYRVIRRQRVACLPLWTIFDQYLPNGMAIDVLSVDVEGLDLEVLQSSDWARFRPHLVVAEDLGITALEEVSDSPIAMYMKRQGYTAIAKTVISLFFRRNE